MTITPRIKVIAHDLWAIGAAWVFALFARFNFEVPPSEFLSPAFSALPGVMLIQALGIGLVGVINWVYLISTLRRTKDQASAATDTTTRSSRH